MEFEKLVEKLNAKNNGSWFSCSWVSELPLTAKAKKAGVVGTKTTTAQCRKGISYANQKSVMQKVAEGYTLTHELPWGQWKEGYEGLMIEHKGNDYVRLYFGPNAAKTTYNVDGKEMTYTELQESGLVVNSYFKPSTEKPDAFVVKVANIAEVF